MNPPKSIIAAYVRQSLAKETDYSFGIQEKEIADFAARNFPGAEIRWFREKVSAKVGSKRPEFAVLREAVKRQEVEAVLAYAMTRMGRSAAEVISFIALAHAKGIRLIIVSEGIDTANAMGRFVAGMFAGLAQLDNESRAEWAKAAHEIRVNEGRWTGGVVPYGYAYDGKAMKPQQPEAKTIKQAFELYASGKSFKQVGLLLQHPLWRVGAWLHSDTYCGTKLYPALVDAVTYKAAQGRLKAMAHENHGGRLPQHLLLNGLLFCGSCGAKMHSETSSSVNKYGVRYYYRRYVCSGRKADVRECRNLHARIGAPQIEARVVAQLHKHLNSTRMVDARRKAAKGAKGASTDTKAIMKRLKQIPDARRRLLDAMGLPAFKSSVEEIGARLELLDAEERELKSRLVVKAAPALDEAAIVALWSRMETWNKLSFSDKRQLLCALVRRIEWDGEVVKVAYN